jgi:hypothetical protein
MSAPVRTITPEEYIERRVKQYQSWYDKKAIGCKRRYLRMRAFTVIAGGIVPVFINVESSINGFIGYPVMRAVVTAISLFVVVAVSLESVFHYGEQWKNYRSTEQRLGHEQYQFLAKIGVYKALSPDDAFELFVEKIEDAISSENAATLNVMASGSGTPGDRSK